VAAGVALNLSRRRPVFVLDPPAILALAALISSVSALVWAIRRKA
jgi:hypothetical protein